MYHKNIYYYSLYTPLLFMFNIKKDIQHQKANDRPMKVFLIMQTFIGENAVYMSIHCPILKVHILQILPCLQCPNAIFTQFTQMWSLESHETSWCWSNTVNIDNSTWDIIKVWLADCDLAFKRLAQYKDDEGRVAHLPQQQEMIILTQRNRCSKVTELLG